ncbi:MAG: lipoyl(octanoyl) transferase LipB [Proteobacteria bacterium]|nr:lipoyl(octanoyl) transferase LipB [Pseudomonadota bacterium]
MQAHDTTKRIFIGQDVPYLEALSMQEQAVAGLLSGTAGQTAFFCEHAPVYTAGTSAPVGDYIGGLNIPVIKTGRGGRYTYHGPGQRVVYPIIDLRERNRDLRGYVCDLQKWLIATLKDFDISAYTRDEVGVWVDTPAGAEKIAAVGVRVRKWIAFHGIALNIHPDMGHFRGIIPCGIADKGVTSLHKLGVQASMADVDERLTHHFERVFATHVQDAS